MKKLFIKNYWAMKGLALLVLVMMGGGVKGQSLYEDFNYTSTLNIGGATITTGGPVNNWYTQSNSQTGVIPVTSGSLTYPGLKTSTGDKITMPGSNSTVPRDVNRAISGTGSSIAYYSALINVIDNTQLSSTADYFMAFGSTSGTSTPSYGGRLGIRSVNGGLNFRFSIGNISGGTGNPTYTDFATDLNFGTTYLIVVKYDKSTSPNTAYLCVNPSGLSLVEPNNFVQNSTGTSVLSTFASIALRNSSNTPKADIDEIRVGTTWADVTPKAIYRTKTSGNWTSLSTWAMSSDSSTWIDATTIPDQYSSFTNILSTHSVTLDANTTISNTSVASTGSLIVSSTKTLTIPAGKSLTLKSDVNGTASIGNSAGTITGNITVERFIPANRKYRFLAAPVVGATAVQWRDNGGTTPGIGTHITGGSVGSNFDQSTLNAPSAFWYNEVNAGNLSDVSSGATSDPGWTAFTNGNTQDLTNGKGFRIFVRGDRTLSLTGSIPTANNTTLSVTGSYPANSVTIATTKTNSNTNSGFNLVGNPYPATIDWNTVTKGANISDTYSTFNPSSNSYVMWNRSTGDATRYIASGQAFFVQQTGAIGGITIAEANKVSNTAGNFFRNKLTDHLKVSLKYDSANYDAAFIHFREDAQNDFDNFDGLKFQNAGVNIASVGSDGKRHNINSLASLTETTEIPLSVLGSALTNFELKFEDVESFKNHELYLIDHYLNKMLLLSDGFTYPIALSSDSASVKDGRFKIVFVQKATGIQNNNKNANAFILYPNPAANTIHLLLDAKNTYNENVSFEIFNQLGARLQQGNLDFTTAKDQTIAIDQLAQGSYFIKLQSNSNQQTIKFIK